VDAETKKKVPAKASWMQVDSTAKDSVICAKGCFTRQGVLHSTKKGWCAFFTCKNIECKSRKDYFHVDVARGFSNLEAHAATCWGDEYQNHIAKVRKESKSADGQRALMDRVFKVVRAPWGLGVGYTKMLLMRPPVLPG
jgi:hypothetical protein